MIVVDTVAAAAALGGVWLALSARIIKQYERGLVFRLGRVRESVRGPGLAMFEWGIHIDRVEIKDVALPDSMKRSMSRQAEAERERRARVITADGELQASQKLAEAAATMADTPTPLQLRLLETVVEVAAEKNSTLVLPFPVELLRFLEHGPARVVSPEPAPAARAVSEQQPPASRAVSEQQPPASRAVSEQQPPASRAAPGRTEADGNGLAGSRWDITPRDKDDPLV
jgi:hypothetical protein